MNVSYMKASAAIYSWYIKNRALRNLITNSEMKLHMKDLVAEIIENAIAPLDSLDIGENGQRPYFKVPDRELDPDEPLVDSPDWIPPGQKRSEMVTRVKNVIKSIFAGFVSTAQKGVERANIKMGLIEHRGRSWNFKSTTRTLSYMITGKGTIWSESQPSSPIGHSTSSLSIHVNGNHANNRTSDVNGHGHDHGHDYGEVDKK